MTSDRRQAQRAPTADAAPRSAYPVLRKGIEEFNSGRFFEAHETLEEIWLPSPQPLRDFYQGIIQIAAAFVHFQRGERPGAERLLRRGLAKLDAFAPEFMGVDVGKLIADAQRLQQALTALDKEAMDRLDPALLPKIRVRPPPARARKSRGPGRGKPPEESCPLRDRGL
jgi:predicted metal-dependent hydrolase